VFCLLRISKAHSLQAKHIALTSSPHFFSCNGADLAEQAFYSVRNTIHGEEFEQAVRLQCKAKPFLLALLRKRTSVAKLKRIA